MDRGAWWVPVRGISESNTTEQLSTHTDTHTHMVVLCLVFEELPDWFSMAAVPPAWNMILSAQKKAELINVEVRLAHTIA